MKVAKSSTFDNIAWRKHFTDIISLFSTNMT